MVPLLILSRPSFKCVQPLILQGPQEAATPENSPTSSLTSSHSLLGRTKWWKAPVEMFSLTPAQAGCKSPSPFAMHHNRPQISHTTTEELVSLSPGGSQSLRTTQIICQQLVAKGTQPGPTPSHRAHLHRTLSEVSHFRFSAAYERWESPRETWGETLSGDLNHRTIES